MLDRSRILVIVFSATLLFPLWAVGSHAHTLVPLAPQTPEPSGSPTPEPSGSPSPAPSGSPGATPTPSPTETPQAIQVLNPIPSISSPPVISDRFDGVDATYPIVAQLAQDVPNAVVEATYKPDSANAVETTIGLLDPVPGTSLTYATEWDIPSTLAEGTGTLVVSAYAYTTSGFEQVGADEVAVELSHRALAAGVPTEQSDAAAITWPQQGRQIGFYRPRVGAWRTAVDGVASADATHVEIYYATLEPGFEPKFSSCGRMQLNTVNLDGTKPFSVRCTISPLISPLQVNAIAAVPQFRQDLAGIVLPAASDARAVSVYLQEPEDMTIVPQTEIVRGIAGSGCLRIKTTVVDQLGRPVIGANVDFHAQGPSDVLSVLEPGSAPAAGNHSIESFQQCPIPFPPVDLRPTVRQGKHRIPGKPDIVHVETLNGSGLALDDTPPGEVVVAASSTTPGFTHITAWIDDEQIKRVDDQRPEDTDALEPGESSIELRAQWYGELPKVTFDQSGGTALLDSCVPFTVKVRTGTKAVPSANIDVHGAGPDDGALAFCDPLRGSEVRRPDNEASDHEMVDGFAGSHANPEGPDPIHVEGETDELGNFVVGVRSSSPGDTELTAWFDGEVGQDDDIQDAAETVAAGRAATAHLSWSSSITDAKISFINPSPYGGTHSAGTPGPGSGTQLPDQGGSVRVLTRVDSPFPVEGVEILFSRNGQTFEHLGRAAPVPGTDLYQLDWDIAVPDGTTYSLRARLVGMPDVSTDIPIRVGSGASAGAPNPPYETVRIVQPRPGAAVAFDGQHVAMTGIAGAGAEGVDLFYTKARGRKTPEASDWIFCGYVDLDGTGNGNQQFTRDCILRGADQAHQISGLAAITYDCTVPGCDAQPTPPTPAPQVPSMRANGQKDSGDAVRVFGFEIRPLLSIEPAEVESTIGTCRRFVVWLQDQTGQAIPRQNVDLHLETPEGSSLCDPGDASVWNLPVAGGHSTSSLPPEPPHDAYHEDASTGTRTYHLEGITGADGKLVFGLVSTQEGDVGAMAWLDRNGDDVRGSDEPSDPVLAHWITIDGCTLLGTDGSDLIVGTRGADRICGLGGDDRIDGRGGRDVILGGWGTDVIEGGAGNDTLKGEGGRDRLIGGPGSDRLLGGPGADRCRGGPGSDRLVACE